MTKQVHDEFFWHGEEYKIALSWGEGALTAKDIGIIPTTDTSCHRGFIASYEISNKKLYLSKISFTASPEMEQNFNPCLVPFTGEIWLVKDLMTNSYSELTIDYQNLYHLGLWNGVLEFCQDLSLQNAQMRQHYLRDKNDKNIMYNRWLEFNAWQDIGWWANYYLRDWGTLIPG